jgi:hypothetical protein
MPHRYRSVAIDGAGVLFFALASVFALAFVHASPSMAASGCPNEAIRVEQGSAALALPACRAYELVSPGSNPSVTSDGEVQFAGRAAPDGEALAYFSRYPAETSIGSSEWWRSTRSSAGWKVEAAAPQDTTSPSLDSRCATGVAFSETLTASLLADGWNTALDVPKPGACGHPLEELVPGEPRGFGNLYLRNTPSGPYQLVNEPSPGALPANAQFQAASADLSHVVFGEEAQLTAEAAVGYNIYEWASGVLRLIGILPSGAPVPADLAAGGSRLAQPPTPAGNLAGGPEVGGAAVMHGVSVDGERVFFYANGNLYLRENAGQPPAAHANCLESEEEPGLACTIHVDASRGLGTSGGGEFQYASADGSRVFFTADRALTFPSSAETGKPDLYEYDVETDELTDLTAGGEGPANVRGFSAASEDGSLLYFVARGVLTGSQTNSLGDSAQSGQPNLYLVDDGALTFVATLSPWETGGGIDRGDWREVIGGVNAAPFKPRWSPNGRFVTFPSYAQLTDFDNSPSEPNDCKVGVLNFEGAPCQELFLYDAASKELRCVSCEPAGGRPTGPTAQLMRQQFRHFASGPGYVPRAVNDRGQVFFQTSNALLPADINDAQDVYEYQGGQLHLISSGTAQGDSSFYDASADGRDVFFSTGESLVRADTNGGLSIYDARVDGGFPEPPRPSPACSGDSCRGAGTDAAAGGAAATTTFSGVGNRRPRMCKKGLVRRHDRCIGKHHNRRRARQGRGVR